MPNQMIDGYLLRFFIKPEHLNEFRRGKIRMMSAYYYATLESGGGALYNNRFDMTEGVSYVVNKPAEDELNINEEKFSLKIGGGVERLCINSSTPNSSLKLSCYYYLSKNQLSDGLFQTAFAGMKDDLGEYYCLFTDPAQFLMRIDNKLKQHMAEQTVTQYQSGFPKYLPVESFHGFVNPFVKPDGLSWQNEYRLVVMTNSAVDPYYLEIGDIIGVSVCGKKSDLLMGKVIDNDNIYIPNAGTSLLP